MTPVDIVRLKALEATGRELREMGARLIAECGEIRRKIGEQRDKILPLKVSSGDAVAVIQQLVASQYQLAVPLMLSKKRPQAISFPRQVSMALCREFLQLPFAVIGARHGGRDHGTVLHAIRAVEDHAATDAAFRRELAALRENVRATIGEALPAAA